VIEREALMDTGSLHDVIVDDRARGMFRVNRQVFTDPEILERERRLIFDRSWLYAGHETEIAAPGDFVTRKVGGRPVILVRDNAGTAHAFLNTCPHRGNIVCREPAGSTRLLRCFYHAWAFDLEGRLAAVPGDDAYSPAFDRAALGLKPAPRFGSYRGMLFLSFDPDIEDLVSYLGGAREYLDLMLEFGGEELEIAHGSQAYSMKANWKLLVENSIDGYHALPTHQRFFNQYLADIGMDASSWSGPNRIQGIGLALGAGHAVIENRARTLPITGSAKAELDAIRARLVDRFGPERAHRIADYSRNLFIFPNLILISSWHTIRTWYPLAPDYIEIDAWANLPRGESPELRQRRFANFISFLGPAGFGTPDDVYALEGCQRGFAAWREVAWSDISRGMGRAQPTSQDELQMRAFWRRWHALILGGRGATDCSDLLPQREAAE
jgi:p-cumate 2,3-dioxygenase subunit alpha